MGSHILSSLAARSQFRMADSGSGDPSGQRVPTPGGSGRGLLTGRRPPAALSPGRLPSMRSRDLTLGGVKKVRVTYWVLVM